MSENPTISTGYELSRYFSPASLSASQTTKAATRARKRSMEQIKLAYATLIEGQAQRVRLNDLSPQTARNRTTALRHFMKANHLALEDVIGLEMRPHFPRALEKMVEELRSKGQTARSISNTKSALMSWKQAVVAHDTEVAYLSNLDTPFMTLLKATLGEHPVATVARQVGIPKDMLLGWLRGKMPRASSANYIRRLERFFGIETGSLVNISGRPVVARRKAALPQPAAIDFRLRQKARPKNAYYLQVPPDSLLRRQWKDLQIYKTQPVPELERSNRGRWTFSSLKAKYFVDSSWYLFMDEREIPASRSAAVGVLSYLGFLALPKDAGGMGLEPGALHTLAWLVVPGYVDKYLLWMKARAGGHTTHGAIQFLGGVVCLVRPGWGFIAQHPDYLSTLPIEFQGIDWSVLCEKQFKYLSKMQVALSNEVVKSRDTFAPIAHILGLDQPMDAIADMVQRLRADRPTSNEYLEAVWGRDMCMVKLFASNPLRMRNHACLEWRPEYRDGRFPESKGALYQRSDGSWWIRIPKNLLKNRGGHTLDYNSPVHASVWHELERYLFVYRKVLTRFPTDLVFIAGSRDPLRTTKVKGHGEAYRKAPLQEHRPFMELSGRLQHLTKKYLYKCDGIGAHAFRHIVATSILKANGGDIKTAALVLHDCEATVQKHYSGMQSGDGAKRMGELLATSFARM